VNKVVNQRGARAGELDTAVAGRAHRVLADRAADTICEQSTTSPPGRLYRIAASISKWVGRTGIGRRERQADRWPRRHPEMLRTLGRSAGSTEMP